MLMISDPLLTSIIAGLIVAILIALITPLRKLLCKYIRQLLRVLVRSPDAIGASGVAFISRPEFTEILRERLHSEETLQITIISYTSEVDAGQFQPFHMPKKMRKLNVIKRSIATDLADEQSTNLRRIARGDNVRLWQKKQQSFDVSRHLRNTKSRLPGLEINQYFYDGPPLKRAYIFNSREALLSYYEVIGEEKMPGGSVYKGFSGPSSDALHVNDEGPVGKYLLNAVKNHVKAIYRESRSWEQEKAILDGRVQYPNRKKTPILDLKAVFLDLDGLLYDSLKNYVRAWQCAFRIARVNYREEDVYREEGQPGRVTIENYLKTHRIYDSDLVDEIYDAKKQEMQRLGAPSLFDGAVDLVNRIVDAELDTCVVTGSTRPDIKAKLSQDFNGNLGEKVVTGNDVKHGKPNAEPYLLACEQTGVKPWQAIAIENAPLGIESACQAGVFCIAINSGILGKEELYAAGARAVFNSCLDLSNKWHKVIEVLNHDSIRST